MKLRDCPKRSFGVRVRSTRYFMFLSIPCSLFHSIPFRHETLRNFSRVFRERLKLIFDLRRRRMGNSLVFIELQDSAVVLDSAAAYLDVTNTFKLFQLVFSLRLIDA